MVNTEKPRVKSDEYCPLWREKMSRRCHKCAWYINVMGKNPQGENIFNDWSCAIAWMPLMQIESSQMSRQAGASADKVATEVSKFHESMKGFNIANAHLLRAIAADQREMQSGALLEPKDVTPGYEDGR